MLTFFSPKILPVLNGTRCMAHNGCLREARKHTLFLGQWKMTAPVHMLSSLIDLLMLCADRKLFIAQKIPIKCDATSETISESFE